MKRSQYFFHPILFASLLLGTALFSSVDALSLTKPTATTARRLSSARTTTSAKGYYPSFPSSSSSSSSRVTFQRSAPLALSSSSSSNANSFDSSHDGIDEEKRGIRTKVRQSFGKLSNKLRSRGSKRALMKKKWISMAMAFSTLFLVRHYDGTSSLTNNGMANGPNNAVANSVAVTKTMARGGDIQAGGFLKRPFQILSRAAHTPSAATTTTPSASSPISVDRTIVSNWDTSLRGGGSKKAKTKAPPSTTTTNAAVELSEQTTKTVFGAFRELNSYMKGDKSDALVLLAATALITPLCKLAGTSPILGFLASGMLLGPNGFGVISGIHTTETLAELGIVFFLFEMGIELSVERLKSMKKDVFGLGLSQYTITAFVIGMVAKFAGGLSGPASVVVGGALSLSSSAFVLQLIKDKKELATRFGKASFGVLLLQDLAVVPLLVATPILAGSGSMAGALGSALVKAMLALSGIALAGRFVMNPLFKTVAAADSQEAFLGVILLTALGMSFLTEGLGLSNTLGAFLAGVLLSETKYKYQIEADIAPFRGILLGLFFITVGFEVDVGLIAAKLPIVASIVAGIIAVKTAILTSLCLAFGINKSAAVRTGLILCQGGEFAFVAFALARSVGILSPATTKLLLTSVSLTMALTPFLDSLGAKFAKKIEESSDFTHYLGQDKEASEITEDEDSGFVVVIGYGVVGKVVCDLLDYKFIKYIGMEKDPEKAIQARNKGLPVFFGDIGRPEVAEAFNVGKAKAVIVTIADKAEATRAVIALRRMYPDKQIFARAADTDHAKRLQTTLDVAAMVPILPEDNLLLTLPFAGAVLRSLGAPAEEVNYILAEKRKEVLSGKELERYEEEAVMAQLGMGVIGDEEGKEADVPKKKEEIDAAANKEIIVAKLEEGSPKKKVEEEKEKGSPDAKAKEAEKLKPMLQKIVEANYTPEHMKKAAEKKAGEVEPKADVEDKKELTVLE